MPAKLIEIGPSAHDAERQALRFLVDGLPEGFTVYGNPWLVERNGSIFELDAVVVAPHAIFVVEIKSYRGRIEGTDNDWWLPEKIRSPLRLNRVTAQVLKSHLRSRSYQAGQVWVEGFVFLSATTDVGVRGPASNDRVHTRKTILSAISDPAFVERISQGRSRGAGTSPAERDLLDLFVGVQSGPKPARHVREYEIVSTLEHQDAFTELLGRHKISGDQRVLRVYNVPPLASETQRAHVLDRARWESRVLAKLGRSEGILSADPPFSEEAGIVLPLEYFRGITLATWNERHGSASKSKVQADLKTRVALWLRIAQAIREAHQQGVVHRLLRPDAVLVEDIVDPTQIRVTGFDLAKQVAVDSTVSVSSVSDDRLVYAAPEVVSSFSSAEPASDQFSLGALLALMLTGVPLFENTRQLMAAPRVVRRIRDVAPRLPLSLDEAVSRMVAMRPVDRFADLAAAMDEVRRALGPEPRALAFAAPAPSVDPDNLEPGTRVGTDYEIVSRLGQGGMSVVYAARHLVSGRVRALKIARTETAAEEALRAEYQVLSGLDHPNVGHVVDLTKMVEGRLTLVLDRVGDETLRQWIQSGRTSEAASRRSLAEDLFAGLDYLEQKGVTHKDLKPDNLLVSDGRLTIIDFSLALMPNDAPYGGTALYRDPASQHWTHATDRFAAGLCLFELYAGRHAFDGRVPEPLQAPLVRDEDIDPPGLGAFFRKTLDPVLENRFPSARAMREAFLIALGEDVPSALSSPPPKEVDATTPLRVSGLTRRAQSVLARSQIVTVGQLMAVPVAQVRAMHAIGTKTADDIVAFQEEMARRGLGGEALASGIAESVLVSALCDSPEPLRKLAVPERVRTALSKASLPTIGAVASLTRAQLLLVPGIGTRKLAEVVEALYKFRDRNEPSTDAAHTLDRLWELASQAIPDAQRIAIERVVGLLSEPETQDQVANDVGRSQPQISLDVSGGLASLDLGVLAEIERGIDMMLDGFGGVASLDELGRRIEEGWPSGIVSGAGMIRLLGRTSAGRLCLFEVDGVESAVVARPAFGRDMLRGFASEAHRLASQWPLVEPETARRALSSRLPGFAGDPLSLAMRLFHDVRVAETGHLFVGPLDARQSLSFVLEQAREPIALDELAARVRGVFGEDTPYPTDVPYLLKLLGELDCRVQGDRVLPGKTGSILAAQPLAADPVPLGRGLPGAARTAEETVRDMLREAAGSRGYRMLVVPPEQLASIGRSVAHVLGGTFLSLDDAFFEDHADDMPSLQRAERFVAQRGALAEAAESTLFRLVEEHGREGRVLVLGDTALLGVCDALDLPRRLYDETLSGSLGFWVLVVPGVIHNRQPRFNEGQPMWHLEGATLGLLRPLPPTASPLAHGAAR